MSKSNRHERARRAAIGRKFGKLTVLSFFKSSARRNYAWYFRCKCSCDREHNIACHRVLSGDVKSCPHCIARAAGIVGNVFKSVEYHCWADMRHRCTAPRCRDYPSYGGRGLKVCPRWMRGENGLCGFLCFLQDMGRRPASKRSIGRIDNDGDYSPDNCRWETYDEQVVNKRSTWRLSNGKPLATAAREAGISAHLAIERLQRGESERRALRPVSIKREPRRKIRITRQTTWIVVSGKRMALVNAAIKYGVTAGTIRARMERGVPPELAVLPRRMNRMEGRRHAA